MAPPGATWQAIASAGLDERLITHPRTGLIVGTGGPSTRAIVEAADSTREKGSPRRVGPFAVPKAMSSTASATLATLFRILGVNYSISSACSTSAHCIGNAAELIQWGKQDIVFAGGHDTSAISVNNGDCDAGFAFDSMVTSILPSQGDIEEGEIKIVWESPIIAGSPMAMRTGLPESLQAAITEIFAEKINVDWAADNGYCETNDPLLCSFSDEEIWGYVARDDSFYEPIRQLCRDLGPENAPQCDGI